MKRACTPENVVASIAALKEVTDLDDLMNSFSHDAQAAYFDEYAKVHGRAYEQTKDLARVDVEPHVEKLVRGMPENKSLLNMAKQVINENKWANEWLGDDIVDGAQFVIEDHLGEYGTERSPESIRQYKKAMEEYFDDVDTSFLGPEQERYFLRYRDYMVDDGGPIYAISKQTGLGQAVSNVGNNAIKSSFTVLLGNPLEVASKLPALYRDSVAEGLKDFISQNAAFKKLPELEKAGAYGFQASAGEPLSTWENLNKQWEGLNANADIPWKNLVYLTGKAAGGHAEGMKALEKVLFMGRAANIPEQRWHASGRAETRMLNYTINSMKLGAGLIHEAVTNKGGSRGDALASLAIMGGIASALGGPGSLIPKPLEDLIVKFNPDAQEELDKWKWGASGLIQNTGIGRVGITYDMASRTLGKINKQFNLAAQAAGEGNVAGALGEGALGALIAMAGTNNILGDSLVQKIIFNAKEQIFDQMDNDPAEEWTKDLLPFLTESQRQGVSDWVADLATR